MLGVAALILAAGESSRFGSPKQLAQFCGQSLVRRIITEASIAGCSPTLVVIGSQKEELAADLREANARIVENRDWQSGIGSSIRAGMFALAMEQNVAAVILLVCDQPFVDAEVIKGLIALRTKTGKEVVASSYSDTLGVPALFDRSVFPELLALKGASGAKKIILANRKRVAEFLFPEGKIDIDKIEDCRSVSELLRRKYPVIIKRQQLETASRRSRLTPSIKRTGPSRNSRMRPSQTVR